MDQDQKPKVFLPVNPKTKVAIFARVSIFVLFVLTLYLMFLVFKPFLPGLLWAVFLSTAFYPVFATLKKWLRGRDWLASVFTTVMVASLIVIPGIVVVSTLTDAVTHMLPETEAKIKVWIESSKTFVETPEPEVHHYMDMTWLERVRVLLKKYLDPSLLDLNRMLFPTLQKLGLGIAGQTAPILHNVFKTVMAFFVMVITMVFLFKEGHTVMEVSRNFLPLQEHDKNAVFKRLQEVSRAVFYGVMLTALVQAILGTLGWAICGLPTPVTFGILMFFCALIPIGGVALVWLPGAIYLFTKGETGWGIFLGLWGLIVVSGVDNLLKPYFISGQGKIHMLLVFFGIFGGLTAFGFAGLFLGPLVITFFMTLVEVVRRDLFQNVSDPS